MIIQRNLIIFIDLNVYNPMLKRKNEIRILKRR